MHITTNDPSWPSWIVRYFGSSIDRSSASVQVMSTLSPTFTLANACLSSTRLVYFQPFGPVNVIEGTAISIAAMVAAGADGLSVDAGKTLMVEGEGVIEAANEAGIVVVGRQSA